MDDECRDDHSSGIYIIQSSSVVVSRNVIGGNIAGRGSIGDGIYIKEGSPQISNNVVVSNDRNGIDLESSSPRIINNTISENDDDGIYISSGSHPSIINNIISYNKKYGIGEASTDADPNPVAFNLFYYNEEGIYYDEGKQGYVSAEQVNKEIAECNNNVEGDPLFKSMVDGDYHLRPGSPAIDAGDPSYDYSNEPKPNGSWINIGAYGNTKEAATSPPGNPSIRLSASSHDFGNIPVAGISPWTLTIHNQGTYKMWVRLSSGDPQFNSSHLFLVVMPSASKDVIIAFTPFSEGVRATSLECDNNLEGDPLFVDITKDDYSLRSPDSRAVDGGNSDSPFDPDGTRADIGAFFFDRKKIIPWDINKDGEINIFDIVIVARNIGQKDKEVKEGDVNVDGKVDIFDLVIVASHFGERSIAASPSLEVSQMDYSQYLSILERVYQLLLVQASSNPSPEFEMARMLLERLISVAKPVVKETKLLANYPNPFNPETWIPFQLAKGSEVVIRIYTVSGQLVRTLWLGFKDYGYYIQKERAAYWDGRNFYGERTASGIYLFTFQAGGYMATGKLLMIK